MPNDASEEEKSAIVSDLNERMGFTGTSLQLKAADFEYNKSKREAYKILLNSTIGKFSMRNDFPEIKYVSSQEEIDDIVKNGEDITSIFSMGDFCQLQIKRQKVLTNKKSNPVVAAFVNALSRISMHKTILKLNTQHFKMLYTDCDSILVAGSKDIKPNINVGLCFGDFKEETKNVISYQALGKKNYCLTYTTPDGHTKSSFKIRGMSLTSHISQGHISAELFKQYLDAAQKGIKEENIVPQIRKMSYPEDFVVKKSIQYHTFSNVLTCQRIVDTKSIHMETFPWDFKKEHVST